MLTDGWGSRNTLVLDKPPPSEFRSLAMNDLTNQTSLKEKLESFLDRACQAEADYPEAERLFRFALRCEELSRPDVGNAREYARQAGLVYEEIKLLAQ